MSAFRIKFVHLVARPELVFLTLSLVFGTFSAVLVPQLSATDENMHFLRAYSLASGNLGDHACTYPDDIYKKARLIYKGDFGAEYTRRINEAKIDHTPCSSAAGYAPLVHVPQALGIFLARIIYPSPGMMVLFGRLFNLVFYALAMYYLIRFTRIGKWAFVVIGLFPLMIHLAASLSGDTMTNVASMSMIAFILSVFSQKAPLSRRQALLLLGLSAAAGLTKPTNAILLLPLVFLPVALFRGERGTLKSIPVRLQKWALIGAAGFVALVCIVGWQKIYGAPFVNPPTNNPLSAHPWHFLRILFNTYIDPLIGYDDIFLRGTVGEFASFSYHLPLYMILLSFGLLLVVLLHGNRDEERATRAVSQRLVLSTLATFGLITLAITYALYVGWAIQPYRLGPGALYADGVQGRYFTALFPLLIPLFIWARKYIWFNTKTESGLGLLVFFGSALLLGFYILETCMYLIGPR